MRKKICILFTVLFLILNVFICNDTLAFMYDGVEYGEYATNDYNLYVLNKAGTHIYVLRCNKEPYYNRYEGAYYTGNDTYTVYYCLVGTPRI